MLEESNHLVEALARLQSYATGQKTAAKQASPPLTIAISRQAATV